MKDVTARVIDGRKMLCLCPLYKTISRTTGPNTGLFVLILMMHFPCWFQIWTYSVPFFWIGFFGKKVSNIRVCNWMCHQQLISVQEMFKNCIYQLIQNYHTTNRILISHSVIKSSTCFDNNHRSLSNKSSTEMSEYDTVHMISSTPS